MPDTPMTYAVGYGRPPEATRFQPGRSGNPKGRPKGSVNLHTLLDDELEARVPVIIDGKTQRLSKAQLAVRQLVDKAAKGELRAMSTLMKLRGQAPSPGATGASPPVGAANTELTSDQYAEILSGIARDFGSDDGL